MAELTDNAEVLRCDALGCEESHPLEHDMLGEECFATGRWVGWVYLDLNRPDLYPRELRFCSVACCQWWLDRERVTRGNQTLSPLDRALRSPTDEILRRQAGLGKKPSGEHPGVLKRPIYQVQMESR